MQVVVEAQVPNLYAILRHVMEAFMGAEPPFVEIYCRDSAKQEARLILAPPEWFVGGRQQQWSKAHSSWQRYPLLIVTSALVKQAMPPAQLISLLSTTLFPMALLRSQVAPIDDVYTALGDIVTASSLIAISEQRFLDCLPAELRTFWRGITVTLTAVQEALQIWGDRLALCLLHSPATMLPTLLGNVSGPSGPLDCAAVLTYNMRRSERAIELLMAHLRSSAAGTVDSAFQLRLLCTRVHELLTWSVSTPFLVAAAAAAA